MDQGCASMKAADLDAVLFIPLSYLFCYIRNIDPFLIILIHHRSCMTIYIRPDHTQGKRTNCEHCKIRSQETSDLSYVFVSPKPHLSFNGITVTCGMRLDPMISYETHKLVFVILQSIMFLHIRKTFWISPFHTVTLYRPFDHGFFQTFFLSFLCFPKIWLLLFHNTATIMPQIITGRKIRILLSIFLCF